MNLMNPQLLSDIFAHALLTEDTRPSPELAASTACDHADTFRAKFAELVRARDQISVTDASLIHLYMHALLCEDTRPSAEQAFDLAVSYVDALRAEQARRWPQQKTIDGQLLDDAAEAAQADTDAAPESTPQIETTTPEDVADTNPAPPPAAEDAAKEVQADDLGAATPTDVSGAVGAIGASDATPI